uniref:ARAD1D34078p n=1 Tax=Blastobotrys adeninivorans TaxID=409370 RepID=A0A060TGW1_BLAAD
MNEPKDQEIEAALKKQVARSDLDVETVKTIRNAVVEQLGLPEDFFKTAEWKSKSRQIIEEAIQNQGNDSAHSDDGDDDEQGNSSGSGNDGDNIENGNDSDNGHKAEKVATKRKRPQKSQEGSGGRRSKTPKPDEIAKLKSQLAQCGIRKQWNKVLGPMGTDSERVDYLKQLLADVGITGRFSAKKAQQVRERRELEELKEDAEKILQSGPRRRPARAAVVDSDSDEHSGDDSDQDKEEQDETNGDKRGDDRDESDENEVSSEEGDDDGAFESENESDQSESEYEAESD